MTVRYIPNVDHLLDGRYTTRLLDIRDRWQDEASEAAAAGHPRQAWYLETMAAALPAIAAQSRARGQQILAEHGLLPESARLRHVRGGL